MISENISIFSLNTGKSFAEKVTQHLNLPLSNHEEREFEDGEHKIRSLESVRGKDVYIIESLHGETNISVNDKLCRLLFFIGSLKDAAAEKVTVIAPYLCYARKDRKTKSRDPITTKYIAKLFEAAGTDHIVTLDVHNLQAYQNAFRCYNDHLEARKLFVDYFAHTFPTDNYVVMSPDAGGMKRADDFRASLEKKVGKEISVVFMEKKRSKGIVSGQNVVGNVKDKSVIIIDDLISSGTTLSRAAMACMELGAKKVMAAATHGVFSKEASEILINSPLERIVITNTISSYTLNPRLMHERIKVIDTSHLIAECVERLHFGESVLKLLED